MADDDEAELRKLQLAKARREAAEQERRDRLELEAAHEEANAMRARERDAEEQEKYDKSFRGKAKKFLSRAGGGSGDGGDDEPPQARGRGYSTFPSFIFPNTKNKHFGWLLFLVLALVALLWNFGVLKSIKWSYLLTYIVLFIYFYFAGMGVYLGLRTGKMERFWIGLVLFVWLLDMWPATLVPRFFGGWFAVQLSKPFTGFYWPSVDFNTTIIAILSSSFVLVFLYVNMVLDIVKKKYWAFLFGFFFILFMNNLLARYLPRTSILIPYGKIIFLVLSAILIFLAWYFTRKSHRFGSEFTDWLSWMLMSCVFAFFWINNGWTTSMKAVIHAAFIVLFGIGYMRTKENNNAIWQIGMVFLLIIDFYGYGFLWSSDYLMLKFIPILVLFVLTYCYVKAEDAYAFTAFIILVTLMLILSLRAYGYEPQGTVQFNERPGEGDFIDFFQSLGEGLRNFGETSADKATGGLYSATFRSKVEKNQYESLGVYFANTRASQPVFYDDEPVTLWTTIKSRTLSDPVSVSFNCSRYSKQYKIGPDFQNDPKDYVYPPSQFTVFTFEDTDAECTFNPDSNHTKFDVGTNTITLSATYNFDTSAYQKLYFIDRERQRALTRENINPLTEFGITDQTPFTIHTNGPVELAISTQYLISVADGLTFNPNLGILLKNRNIITGKDGKPIGQWTGKIKKINELVIVLPSGMELEDPAQCRPAPFEKINDQKSFCSENQWCKQCEKTCTSGTTLDQQCLLDCRERCIDECNSVFKDDSNSATTEVKLDYVAYRMKTEALYQDNSGTYINVDNTRHLTFGCRIKVSSGILENTPITTKYVRALTRYDYSIDQSWQVNVQKNPTPSYSTTSTGPAPPSVKVCRDFQSREQRFLEGYNKYSAEIKEASKILVGKVQNPEALIAAIISQESQWDTNAVSPCGAAGLGQFVPGTGRTAGLSIPVYSFEWCPSEAATTCKLEKNGVLEKTKVSVCNSCTPSKCDKSSDERFNTAKTINAMAKHLSDLVDQCKSGNPEALVNAYNSGNCAAPAGAHPTYTVNVIDYYKKWQNCFAFATT